MKREKKRNEQEWSVEERRDEKIDSYLDPGSGKGTKF